MLTIYGKSRRYCDGLSRRSFLKVGGLTFGSAMGLTLADVLLYCWINFGNQVGQPLNPANTNIVAWFTRVGERPSAKA